MAEKLMNFFFSFKPICEYTFMLEYVFSSRHTKDERDWRLVFGLCRDKLI